MAANRRIDWSSIPVAAAALVGLAPLSLSLRLRMRHFSRRSRSDMLEYRVRIAPSMAILAFASNGRPPEAAATEQQQGTAPPSLQWRVLVRLLQQRLRSSTRQISTAATSQAQPPKRREGMNAEAGE